MRVFLMSLITLFTALSAAAPAKTPASPTAAFAWLDGTWRTDALELVCRRTTAGIACHEEGRGTAMQGAAADLTITPVVGTPGSQLKVALPGIPPSSFREIARAARSVTYEMPTRIGVARLRFTRERDTLTLERGNAKAWGTTMTYRRG